MPLRPATLYVSCLPKSQHKPSIPTKLFPHPRAKMISDNDLYSLAIFLGSAAMLLIVLYHFLEINAVPEAEEDIKVTAAQTPAKFGSIAR